MTTNLACDCGAVTLAVDERPIIAATCYCTSCRTAGERLASLTDSPVGPDGGTAYVLYRKDRVRFTSGQERLRAFRLKPDSPTRRVVATCCNTPIFVEFKDGHWLSLYSALWPEGQRPAPELRTMTGDLPEGAPLHGDLPAGTLPTLGFYARLLGAWIAMGFKVPKVQVGGEELRI